MTINALFVFAFLSLCTFYMKRSFRDFVARKLSHTLTWHKHKKETQPKHFKECHYLK